MLVVGAVVFAALRWTKGGSSPDSNQSDNSTTESSVSDEGSLEVPLKFDDTHTIVVKCPKGYQDFMSGESQASFIKDNIKYKVSLGDESLESAKEVITSTINYLKNDTDSIIGEPIIGEEMKYKDYDAHYSAISQKIDEESLYTYFIHIDIGAKYTVKAVVEAPEEMEKEKILDLIDFSVK
ncbi:MAG: hypothetical protein J6D02_04820 [Lachnospira sp.]|nr:hypothetical protein [Lachnospira sp.]